MTYAISRGISNLEDIEVLARGKMEEAARIKKTNRSSVEGLSIATYKPIDIMGRHHSGL